MATWRVMLGRDRTIFVHVEAQYAGTAFGLARPLLVQLGADPALSFADCEFKELPPAAAVPGLMGSQRA